MPRLEGGGLVLPLARACRSKPDSPDPAAEGAAAQIVDDLLPVRFAVDQVVHVVEVTFVVVEFFGDAGLEKATHDLVGLAFAVMLFPGGCRLCFPEIGEVLAGRGERHVVLVIGKTLVPHHANAIETFVGSLAKSKVIGGLRFGVLSEKYAALVGVGDPGTGETDWRYIPRVYFIRDHYETPGDGIPALCRLVISGIGLTTTECIAEGIEDFHVQYGIDTDRNGIANIYTSTPTLSEMENAVSSRVYLLARSISTDPHFTNDTQYMLGDATIPAANDGYYRRVYSTTISLRNTIARSLMQ